MALPERVSRDWRNNRGVVYTHNNITYSIAWKQDGKWKTLFRKFELQILRRNLLKGAFSSNLHFEQKLDINEGNTIMIYGVQKDTEYKTIDENFNAESLDFLIYKEIFVMTKKDVDFYLPNLNCKTNWYVRLNGSIHKNNSLQLTLCKSRQLTCTDSANKIVITLPIFTIEY